VRYICTRKAFPAFIACVLSSAVFGDAHTNHAGRAVGGKLTASGGVVCESYTNHAGHAVGGKLTAITNRMAVISGRSYPLSAFPEAEQARMRMALSVPLPLPPALEANRRSLRNRLLRSEAMCNAGAKSREEANRRRAEIETAWSGALDRANLDAATREHWRARLMAEPAAAETTVTTSKEKR